MEDKVRKERWVLCWARKSCTYHLYAPLNAVNLPEYTLKKGVLSKMSLVARINSLMGVLSFIYFFFLMPCHESKKQHLL